MPIPTKGEVLDGVEVVSYSSTFVSKAVDLNINKKSLQAECLQAFLFRAKQHGYRSFLLATFFAFWNKALAWGRTSKALLT